MQVQLHGADELVALATGMLADSGDQLTLQRVPELLESFEVPEARGRC